MGRLLDEDDVIDIINFECGKWIGLSKTIEKEIKALPPAQPERPKGYMKIEANMIDGEYVICETCGAYCLSPLYNFCPICGIEFIGVRGIQDE